MAKKSSGVQTSIPQGNVYVQPIEQVMPQSMLPYAEFVILDRALPRVEDGLKPVQRRILFTMAEMGLTPDKPHKKSARIVGDCMGKYHPHGDSSVYDAMVRMAQPFNMRMTLVNGHGNFGSVDGDPAAAMRYTEARLEPLAMELLKDIDKETVPFSFNFDDSLLEPDILPGRYPNLLVNGANGIAVGLATNIPTHNLGEVIDGCCAYIDNPRISLAEMMKIIPGPDFSTGGYVIANELKQAYETGKGKITLRAKYSVEQGDYGKKLIVITELPYQTNKAELLKKIMLLREEKKILSDSISDIVDESDRTGMRAVVAVKKDADVDAVLQLLFKYTDLECTFGINMVAIAGGKPRQLGLLDMMKYYVRYQQQVVLRRCKFELREAEARCHILEGLIIGVHNVDRVVKIVRSSENTAAARKALMEEFSLSEKQAQAILDLRLARLAKLEIEKLEEEYRQLQARIKTLKEIIADKDKQFAIVKSEMREIKNKYKSPRRTVIVGSDGDINVRRADIKKEVAKWAVCLTAAGTLKLLERDEYDDHCRDKIAANAPLSNIIKDVSFCSGSGEFIAFTNFGNCVRIRLSECEPCAYNHAGVKLASLAEGVAKGELPVKVFAFDAVPGGDLLFFMSDGAVKRTAWSEYDVSKRVYQAAKLKDGAEVINVEQYVDDPESFVVSITLRGLAAVYEKKEIPVQGRISGGVRGTTLAGDDRVVSAMQTTGVGEAVIATSGGLFKRVAVCRFDVCRRGVKGIIAVETRVGKERFEVIFADAVTIPYKLAIVDGEKRVFEKDTEDITIQTRNTRGDRLAGIESVAQVVAMKHRSDYDGGNEQLKI